MRRPRHRPHYRHRAEFQRFSDLGEDAHGQPLGIWEPLLTAGGNLRIVPGREALEAGRLESNATATLRVLYASEVAAIDAEDRVLIRGVLWNIRSVGEVAAESGGFREMEFRLERGVAVGVDMPAPTGGFPFTLPMTLG